MQSAKRNLQVEVKARNYLAYRRAAKKERISLAWWVRRTLDAEIGRNTALAAPVRGKVTTA